MLIKRGSTLFLKFVILVIALSVLAALLWFPQVEGRNANADSISIYFNDPFLAYVYIASIPFFGALYQSFKLLGYIEQHKVFSTISVRALRNIKYCTIAFSGFISLAIPYLIMIGEQDDAPGAVVMGLVLIFASIVIATGAAVFENLLQNAVDLKSENDLTV